MKKFTPTNLQREKKIEEKIYQHSAGYWICEIIDNEYPYGSVVAFGSDDIEAKMNAWYQRKQILEKQLSTSPTLAIPVETYKEAMERII